MLAIVATFVLTFPSLFDKKPTSPNTPIQGEIYNSWATDLSTSDKELDKTTLAWYKNNTASVFVNGGDGYVGSQGTIWNYPSPSGDLSNTYFATNIHVVSSALIPDSNNTYTFNSNYKLFSSQDTKTYIQLADISLYYVATQSKPIGLSELAWDGDYYSDFAILKTSTALFKSKNNLNFMDNDVEYNWFVGNFEKVSYYMCGFPNAGGFRWPISTTWVNIKYDWDESAGDWGFGPLLGTSSTFNLNYLSKSTVGAYRIGEWGNTRFAKNYTQHLLLPGLNAHSGSSGSLVSIKYGNTLMPIGIYWGGYQVEDSDDFLGGVELFYVGNPYRHGSYGDVLSYNNLK